MYQHMQGGTGGLKSQHCQNQIGEYVKQSVMAVTYIDAADS
jgi:hypothetical protein